MSSTDNLNFNDINISDVSDVSEGSNVELGDTKSNRLDPGGIDLNLFATPGPRTVAQRTEKEPALEFSSLTSSPLHKLPVELRLLVYGLLIAAGDLNIMRTSKLVHKEAADVLQKHAVLRMNFGFDDRRSLASFPLTASINLAGNLTCQAPKYIQRIECRFDMASEDLQLDYFDAYTYLIKSFGGREVPRELCTIFLDLGEFDLTTIVFSFSREAPWQAITELIGFKTLVFKIRRDLGPNFEEDCLQELGRLSPGHGNSYSQRFLLQDYQTLREDLMATLGPAILDKSVEDHGLEFHPSDFRPDRNAEIDTGV